jgi:DNA-binding MarR family transcriptional regulator
MFTARYASEGEGNVAQDFSERLPYTMRMVSQALSQQLERTLRPLGLTHAQLAALAQLGRDPNLGYSGADLANRAGVTPQSMSSAIGSLLERGLVVRTPHPTHGRVLEVRITESGAALLQRAEAAATTVEDRAVAQLSDEEQAQLSALIHKLMQTLDLYVVERVLP